MSLEFDEAAAVAHINKCVDDAVGSDTHTHDARHVASLKRLALQSMRWQHWKMSEQVSPLLSALREEIADLVRMSDKQSEQFHRLREENIRLKAAVEASKNYLDQCGLVIDGSFSMGLIPHGDNIAAQGLAAIDEILNGGEK